MERQREREREKIDAYRERGRERDKDTERERTSRPCSWARIARDMTLSPASTSSARSTAPDTEEYTCENAQQFSSF